MRIQSDKVLLTDEEFEKLSTLTHFIAMRYANWSGIEYDDLKSSLWVKTLELLKNGDEGDIEMNWIAKCCYNLAKDICRKAKKYVENVDVNTDALTEDEQIYDPWLLEDDSLFMDSLNVRDIMDMFPKNSRERNYLVYLTLYIGIPVEEHRERQLTYDKVYGRYPEDMRREKAIAMALGFSDDTSSGYRRAKYAVRDRLAEEYNIRV